jgi:SSS family solute:Na+ symporter
VPYIGDQALLQRLLTTPTEKLAARAIWVHAIIVIPGSLLFFGLGTALFTFFKSNPDALQASALSHDTILPWFVATQFPVGLAGLVIAGLFAATMSSVDSSINSVATCLVTDFDRKLRPHADDASRLRLARALTILVGILATLSAGAISLMDAKSLWSLILKVAGLFGSSLTGTLLLGMCTRRANSGGVLIGIITSMVVLFVVQSMNEMLEEPLVHGFLYAAVGIITCMVVGYLASVVLGGETRSVAGLTLKTLKKQEE